MIEAPARPDLVPAELLDRVVRYFAPEAVILFGSHARGEAGPDSDYDLLVILPDDAALFDWELDAILVNLVLLGARTADLTRLGEPDYEAGDAALRARLPAALLEGGRVLVLEGGKLAERKVRTGLANWEYTEILDGLAAGDRIVTSLERAGVKAGAAAVDEGKSGR